MVLAGILGALFAVGGECPAVLKAAQTAYENREFTLAASKFEEAKSACGEKVPLLLSLAQAQLMAQQMPASLATLEQLLRSDPENVAALKLKGDVLYLTGKEEEAENVLKSALTFRPGDEASLYALGRIYYQQSRFPEAARQYETILQSNPAHYRAHDNLALAYAALQRDSDATRHFIKALDLVHKNHPEYDVVYANTANFFLDRGQYKKAFQLAAEAAKRNPSSPRNFFLTGKALVKLDKPELSLRWFNEAGALDPAYAEPHYWLAQVYRKLDRQQEAQEALERFRQLNKLPKGRR